MKKRTCKCGCGTSLDKKHPNAKFINIKHKDKYWNRKRQNIKREYDEMDEIRSYAESGWDGHKDTW